MNLDNVTFMKWHENGYISVIADDSTYTSVCPIVKHEWRGYRGEAAWDCDYWDITDKEIEWLNHIVWDKETEE